MTTTKPKKYLPRTEYAIRLSVLFRRKPSTSWTLKEVKMFKHLSPFDEEEFLFVERYYRVNWPPLHGKNMLRHDLATLLNNFASEIDRAKVWAASHPLKTAPRKIIPLPKPMEQQMTAGEREQANADFEKLMGRKLNL